jgi:hypothetical protein
MTSAAAAYAARHDSKKAVARKASPPDDGNHPTPPPPNTRVGGINGTHQQVRLGHVLIKKGFGTEIEAARAAKQLGPGVHAIVARTSRNYEDRVSFYVTSVTKNAALLLPHGPTGTELGLNLDQQSPALSGGPNAPWWRSNVMLQNAWGLYDESNRTQSANDRFQYDSPYFTRIAHQDLSAAHPVQGGSDAGYRPPGKGKGGGSYYYGTGQPPTGPN